jgi:hypothetical protein
LVASIRTPGTSIWMMFRAAFAAAALGLVALAAPRCGAQLNAPGRLDAGRFTFLFHPADSLLAASLLRLSVGRDTFPGLPRPTQPAVIAIAADEREFRELSGPNAPEWGAAVAFPSIGRIVLQGSSAGSTAGDPRLVLRHELAHLALFEHLGNMPPRWFDEGYASYAAGEWKRTDAVWANIIVLSRGTPALDSLDRLFAEGSSAAQAAYALSHLVVESLAALDRERGLTLFFRHWIESRGMDQAVRRAYGVTLGEFEASWKRSVSRRYGIVALVTDLGVVSALMLLLLAPLFIRRRKLLRERLARLRKAEIEAERKTVTEALSDLLGERDQGGGQPAP